MEIGCGLVGMDVLVGHAASSLPLPSSFSPFHEQDLNKQQQQQRALLYGSTSASAAASLKQGRVTGQEEQDWRSMKMARTSLNQVISHEGEQMLSFSSSSSLANDSSITTSLPYYQLSSASPSAAAAAASYSRTAGLSSESTNGSMHGVFSSVRGPFTPSQWVELENQAMIYKYLDANAPVPSNLLIPFRRSLSFPGFSGYSNGSFRSSALGWGSFHLGFSGSADPEPGRCRRTDGKKWRCSRDAVTDGKYCERHMNRGRHRSRKHVEGHTGHAAKAMPVISPSSASAVSGGGSSNDLSMSKQQVKSLQPSLDHSSFQFDRSIMCKDNVINNTQVSMGLSVLANVSSKPMFPITREHQNVILQGNTVQTNFGLISSNSLHHTSRNSYNDNLSFVSSQDVNDRKIQSHHLRHFIDDWPKTKDRSTINWPDDEMQSDRTQLSISIPMGFDFSSPSSFPKNQEKLALSPLKLSCEFDPIHMGLGVGTLNERERKQTSWMRFPWEGSMGGPLGEVLTSTANTPKDNGKNSSSLNLLTDGWDLSPHVESSPTGVLQKTAFGSLSSSAGSSPRAEHVKAHERTSSLCDDLIGSTMVNPSTIPLL